jgi:hypothetical protein
MTCEYLGHTIELVKPPLTRRSVDYSCFGIGLHYNQPTILLFFVML